VNTHIFLKDAHLKTRKKMWRMPVIKWSNETDEQILSLNKIIYRIPYYNAISSGLTYFGPLLWQAKQTLSDLCQLQPATQVGKSSLVPAKQCWSTVLFCTIQPMYPMNEKCKQIPRTVTLKILSYNYSLECAKVWWFYIKYSIVFCADSIRWNSSAIFAVAHLSPPKSCWWKVKRRRLDSKPWRAELI